MLKFLKEIFPPIHILVVLFPILISCYIDYALMDSRSIIINVIWVLIFSLTGILTKSQLPYKILVILYSISGTIEITHWVLIKGPITTTSILVLLNTNMLEAQEFLAIKNTYGLLLLIPFLYLCYKAFRQKIEFTQNRYKVYVVAFLYLIVISFITENAYHQRLIRKGVPQLIKVLYSFKQQLEFFQEVDNCPETKKVEIEQNEQLLPQITVIVIGESCNRNHMSLYNQNVKTTPLLHSRKDIITFTNVVSPYSNTIECILTSLSESNLENKKQTFKCYDIFDVFSSASFKTFWISNQPPLGVWENRVSKFANKADNTVFVNIASNSSMEATLTSSYDSKIFPPLQHALQSSNKNKLIILHLMGSHTNYKNRYPKEFSVFSGNTTKENIIATYHNSILYNDFIVDSILKCVAYYAQDSLISSVMYISDHGENVYDYNNNVGHDYTTRIPRSNVEIPLILWLSPAFQKQFPHKVQTIEANKNKPFVSDDLFHCMLDLCHIPTPLLDQSRSVFSEKYNFQRKRFLADGLDYDLK